MKLLVNYRELERKLGFHQTGASNIQLHKEEQMVESKIENSSAWHYMRQVASFTFEIFINSDYVRVIRTRITAMTQCTLGVIGARDDRDIDGSVFRLDSTNNQVSQRITLSRDERQANREEKSSVLTSKIDDRAHRRITWPNQMRAKEKGRGGGRSSWS